LVAAALGSRETRLGRDERRNVEQAIAEYGYDMNGNRYASTASHKVTGTASGA